MAKKLASMDEKMFIYNLYIRKGFSQAKIAQLYDVSQSTISQIIKEVKYIIQIKELKENNLDSNERYLIKGRDSK